MHCSANRLLPAGISLLTGVWKMCQDQGFAHPQTFTCCLLHISVNIIIWTKFVAEESFHYAAEMWHNGAKAEAVALH